MTDRSPLTALRPSAAALLALLLVACAGAPHPSTSPEFFASPDSAMRSLPFSEAVRVGDLLFLSGQIGVAPGTAGVVPGGLEAESRQALANVRGILERHGSSLDRVVKCTIFLADIRDWPAFNVIYRETFHPPYPARGAFGTSGLAMGAKVEVECIATVR